MKAIPLSRRFDLLNERVFSVESAVKTALGIAAVALTLAVAEAAVILYVVSTVWTMPC